MSARGKVKWFDTEKGYGFIVGEGGEELFVHFTSIAGEGFRDLAEGQAVEYEVIETRRGKQATNVVRVEAAEAED